jgi:hypothetical protein
MAGNHTEIERRLWDAADELRANSKLKSSEYSTPVLGLIFLRYADHKFAIAEREINASRPANSRRIVGKTDYQARGVLYLPEAARFANLLKLPEGADIGKAINDAMKAIEAENDDLKGVLPKTYSAFEKGTLVTLLKQFAAIPMDIGGDVFGKIYEYFLGEFARAEGSKGGEFFTPTCLVSLIVEIIEPYHGLILDPACGSGGMFVQSARFVQKHKKNPNAEISIYGQERVAETVRLCKMNLAVHGLAGDIREANTYYEDLHECVGKFDFVKANPPFNVDRVDKDRLAKDKRFPFGLPRTDNAIRLWPRPLSDLQYAASAEALPEPEGLSSGEKRRLEYWRHLNVRLEERGTPHDLVVPTSEGSIDIAIGKSGFVRIQLGVYPQHKQVYVSLLLSEDVGDAVAKRLEDHKGEIERELGYPLHWEIEEGWADIYVDDDGVQVWDKEDWPVQHDWLGDKLEDYLRVLKPRVEAYEQEALADPEIKQVVEKYQQFVDYWEACAKEIQGATVSFREGELERGRKTCRFEKIETGIFFAAQCYPENNEIYVTFGVVDSAGRKLRSKFTDLHNREVAALESELGEKLEWDDAYVWATSAAKIEDKADWPRQHKWIRETAEKFSKVFKARLGLD